MVPPTRPANGVLPMPAAVRQKKSPANGAPTAPASRPSAPRLKLVIRRLPPGLTQAEFEATIGEEWKLGGGKVDWMVYKPGKVSTNLAKPSRPSTAYLHLTDKDHIMPFSESFRQNSFTDAKNSSKDSALVGPPTVELATYTRIPLERRRKDARQGTIDQDPEFIDFLESLTNPIPKPAAVDAAADAQPQKEEKVVTTPLIEHLREKKAAKEKAAAVKVVPKHGRQELRDEKADKTSDKKASGKVAKDTAASPEKGRRMTKAEKAAREAVKILAKDVTSGSQPSQQAVKPGTEPKPPTTPAAERKRERGNASVAARMLQRDLGIGPTAGGRRGARRDATNENAEKQADTTTPAVSTSSTIQEAEKGAANNASPLKKEAKPSRSDRRGQKPALTEKTNVDPTAETSKSAPKIPTGPAAAPTILKKPPTESQTQAQQAPQPPKGPAASRQPPPSRAPPTAPFATTTAPPPTSTPPTAPASASTPPTQPTRQAFLKHANPSQGITESLIETALSVFGAIEKVEIDKRKGFAYVDFADPDGLQRAIAASPVKVAQGAVQVLERKDRAPARVPVVPPVGPQGRGGAGGGHFRGGRGGGGRGGRGGHAVRGGAVGPAAPAASAAGGSAGSSPSPAPSAPTAPAAQATPAAAGSIVGA